MERLRRQVARWNPPPKPKSSAIELVDAGAYAAFQAKYQFDPVGFARDCIHWDEDKGLAGYQEDILGALCEHKRVSAVGPHGLGKSTIAAILINWYALTRDGKDWKIITTASVWAQLELYLWPEVHKWARRIRWDRVGRAPYREGDELLMLSLELSTGAAAALSPDKPSSIEGAHADHLLYVFDESKAIPDSIFDAAEGAMGTTGEIYVAAISTPGPSDGRFYDIHNKREKFARWWVRAVTRDECIAAGRMALEWAEGLRREWGDDNPDYLMRVLGQFVSKDLPNGVIPRAWVKAAQQRWVLMREQWAKAGTMPPVVGRAVDVGGDGEDSDKTFMATRRDRNFIEELVEMKQMDTMLMAVEVYRTVRATAPFGWIRPDMIGLGAGLGHRLRQLGFDVRPFIASEGTHERDSTGEIEFENLRALAWWRAREKLDPSSGAMVALPPSKTLEDDLCAPTRTYGKGGRMLIESKKELRKRLGRSTDEGDVVVMALYDDRVASPPQKGKPIVRPLG